jgi:uncharacterized protein involved in tolerance to divalent cations
LEIKPNVDNYKEIEDLIKSNNSYDIAQIIAISIKNGSAQYLD